MPFARGLLAAAAALLVMAPAAAVASAQAPPDPGVGIRLLEAPATRRDDPRARRFIIDHVAPGATINRAIEVSNGSDRTATFPLYAAAATLDRDAFTPAAGRAANELSGWISVSPSEVTLAPGERARADVTIAVPPDAGAGERYAVVLAELPPPPPPPGATVAVASRAGIRVYLSVGPGAEPPTSFQLESFAPGLDGQGQPAITVHTCNTGGRALDLTGDVSLTDGPGGTSAGPFPTSGAETLAPAACGDLTIALRKGLPHGPWKATVTLRSGTKEQAATATITFPDEAGTKAPPVEAKPKQVTGTGRGRLALLLALLLLLAVLALLVFLLRRGRDEGSGEPPATASPQS